MRPVARSDISANEVSYTSTLLWNELFVKTIPYKIHNQKPKDFQKEFLKPKFWKKSPPPLQKVTPKSYTKKLKITPKSYTKKLKGVFG